MEQREPEHSPALRVQCCDPDIVMTSGATDNQITWKKSVLRIAQIINQVIVAPVGIRNEKEILFAEWAFDSRSAFFLGIGAFTPFQKQRCIIIRKEDRRMNLVMQRIQLMSFQSCDTLLRQCPAPATHPR